MCNIKHTENIILTICATTKIKKIKYASVQKMFNYMFTTIDGHLESLTKTRSNIKIVVHIMLVTEKLANNQLSITCLLFFLICSDTL